MQPPALDQGHAGIDEAGHRRETVGPGLPARAGGWTTRAGGLSTGPQGLLQGTVDVAVAARLEQEQPIRIETEAGEPVAIGQRMPLRDDEERLAPDGGEAPGHEGEGEAQGRRLVALGLGGDLVQVAEAEAAAGQVPVDGVDPEGQGLARGVPPIVERHACPQGREPGGDGGGIPVRPGGRIRWVGMGVGALRHPGGSMAG